MKKSPLHAVHSATPKTVPYEGMELPVYFTDSLEELAAAQSGVAMFDRSFFEVIAVRGKDRCDFLQRISSNDLSGTSPSTPRPTIFTNEKGRVIDYVWVVDRGEDLLLVASPGSAPTLVPWIERFVIMEDVQLECISGSTAMISLIGPSAPELEIHASPGITRYATDDFHCTMVHLVGSPSALSTVWATTMAVKMGVAAFDLLRVTRGIPLWGREISDRFNPYDLSLLHAVSYTKGCYIGQEVIARLDTYQKSTKRLFGIRFANNTGPVSEGSPVRLGQEDAGILTSVTRGGSAGRMLGLGVLKKDLRGGESVRVGDTAQGTVEILPMSFSH